MMSSNLSLDLLADPERHDFTRLTHARRMRALPSFISRGRTLTLVCHQLCQLSVPQQRRCRGVVVVSHIEVAQYRCNLQISGHLWCSCSCSSTRDHVIWASAFGHTWEMAAVIAEKGFVILECCFFRTEIFIVFLMTIMTTDDL